MRLPANRQEDDVARDSQRARTLSRFLSWLSALAVLITTACGSQPPLAPLVPTNAVPIPVPVSLGFDGTWIGKTDQAGATTPVRNVDLGYFSLVVVNDRVTSLDYQVSFDPPCAGYLVGGSSLNAPIASDGSFAASRESIGSGLTLSGTFSTTQAAGSFTFHYHPPNSCESIKTVTWTASR